MKNLISKTGWEKLHEIRSAFGWLFFGLTFNYWCFC